TSCCSGCRGGSSSSKYCGRSGRGGGRFSRSRSRWLPKNPAIRASFDRLLHRPIGLLVLAVIFTGLQQPVQKPLLQVIVGFVADHPGLELLFELEHLAADAVNVVVLPLGLL